MPLTPKTASQVARARRNASFVFPPRLQETGALLLATLLLFIGLARVYQAKQAAFANFEARLAKRELLNLNRVSTREELLPYLSVLDTAAEQQFAARKLFDYLSGADTGQRRVLANVGALSDIRLYEAEVAQGAGLEPYRKRFEARRQSAAFRAAQLAPSPREWLRRWLSSTEQEPLTLRLLTGDELREDLKPLFVVREPGEFRAQFWRWVALYFAFFYVVHLAWWAGGFKGDGLILPTLHLLTGIGLMLMVSLQDPLRDTLLFARFIWGVGWGALLLGLLACADRLPAWLNWLCGRRMPAMLRGEAGTRAYLIPGLRELGYLPPLVLGLLLSLALILFGSGPAGSSAKVNLGPVQPIELIKPLLALFFAAYFTKHWEMLRATKQERVARFKLPRWLRLPQTHYLMPVLIAVGGALLFFVAQRDLGPALVIASLFLLLYGVARARVWLALGGFLLILAGFAAGYWLNLPATVHDRIVMFLSPWENAVRGGDQVAHALWGLAAGGAFGAGLGQGRPGLMPEARTDLILAAIGEELGFAGLSLVFGLYAWLIYRGLRIALRATESYAFFLALGLTLLLALQIALIAGGVFDLFPLSGVVSPFLSAGRSSMIANLALMGLLLALSASTGATPSASAPAVAASFRRPVRWLAGALALLGLLILGQAARVQLWHADETLSASALAVQSDDTLDYSYNPRLREMRRLIPRGGIYDRSGLPLASSKWDELNQNRARYARLGVTVPSPPVAAARSRYYPFREYTYHLLGDWRTQRNWGATNTSFVERDANTWLQGFDDYVRETKITDPRTGKTYTRQKRDYRALIPLWRERGNPAHPAVKQLLEHNHEVRLSLDMTLQKNLAEHLRGQIEKAKSSNGAAVVLDAKTGELLASISYPWPSSSARLSTDDEPENAEAALLDRARYALRPPGSTFKLVTAIAALRKNLELSRQTYTCRTLPERDCIGNYVSGYNRAVCDDEADVHSHPHGHGQVAMELGIAASCNAYFAQLGVLAVKAEALQQTADLFGISTSRVGTPAGLRASLTQAAYGQGEVVVSPFRLALVSATIANEGVLPAKRWVLTRDEPRESVSILSREAATQLAGYMRRVVTSGTGTKLGTAPVSVAGKTGTAQNNDPRSHSWFTGFAPYGPTAGRRIAFAVLIENGGYGGRAAANAALDLVTEAQRLDLIR